MMGGKGLLLAFVLSIASVCCGQKEFKHNSVSEYYSRRYHGNSSCQDSPVEARARSASVIFSGTVRDLEPNLEDADTQKATVEIKRILKGSQVIGRSPLTLFPGDGRRYVIVEGIGSSRICKSFVRKHDTRIFLVNKGSNGELTLNSSLERITLKNINRFDSLIKHGLDQRMSNQVTTKLDGDSGSTKDSVSSYQATISDNTELVGVSIGTILHQLPSATIRMDNFTVSDVCSQKKCDFYSVCEIDTQGITHCICPGNCEEVISVVCGSDGVTYNNECELQSASCKHQKVITVHSHGVCDACDGINCEFGGECVDGECVCRHNCSLINDPVCANNDVTYPNECTLLKAGCHQMISLEVLHAGSCSEMSGSGGFELNCDDTNCKYGGQCELSANGTLQCVCHFECDAVRSPVCGSDGRTYGNECQLKEDMCHKQISIQIQSMENCGDIDEELCDGEPVLINPVTAKEYDCHRGKDICPTGSYCHKLGTIAKCCREVQQLSDGCAVSRFGCCPDRITLALGPSNAGCPNVCQCNTLGSLSRTCDPVTRQCVCRHGVGGIKCDRCRPNFWGLPQIAEGNSGCLLCGCTIDGSMREDCEQTTGQCTCRPGISGRRCNICPNGKHLQPSGCSDVMLNDDLPSSSFFDASNRSCEKPCEFGAVCRPSDGGEPACVCPMNCSTEQGRQTTFVCGSDGTTYASLCQMVLFACRSQINITASRLEPCHVIGEEDAAAVAFDGLTFLKYRNSVSTVRKSQTTNRFEIEFRSSSSNGLLLLMHKSNSIEADYLAIAVRDGCIEVGLNLGRETPTDLLFLSSPVNVTDGKWHSLLFSRVNRQSQLIVDHKLPVATKLSTPGATHLDTDGYLWIGGCLQRIHGLPEAYLSGFHGCIRYVKVNDEVLDLVKDSEMKGAISFCSTRH